MVKIKSVAIVVCACVLLTLACKPDLTVANYDTADSTANATQYYVVKFQVKNIGREGSGETYVHVDAINPEPPEGTNKVRIRRKLDLRPLEPDEDEGMKCSFAVSELSAESVSIMEITVDPKDFVDECDETNNTETWPWPE